jgi:DNA invertase Pin-like site-specific DNA recombinase
LPELERNIIVERIRGGIRRAREQGKRLGRRPLADPRLLGTVLDMKAQGKSIRAIAEAVKVSKSFVHKTCKNLGSQTLEIPACKN